MRSFHESAENFPPEAARALLVGAVDGIGSDRARALKTKDDFEFLREMLIRRWDEGAEQDETEE